LGKTRERLRALVVVLNLVAQFEFTAARQHLAHATAKGRDIELRADARGLAENAAGRAVRIVSLLVLAVHKERGIEARLGFDHPRLFDGGAVALDLHFEVVGDGALDDFAERESDGRFDADRRSRCGHRRGLRGGRTGGRDVGALQRRGQRLLLPRGDLAGRAPLVQLKLARGSNGERS
jgi:hypothetical protein